MWTMWHDFKKKHNPNWIYYATFSKVYYHQGFESEVLKEISYFCGKKIIWIGPVWNIFNCF